MNKITYKITYDDREFVIVATGSDEDGLHSLAYYLLHKLFPTMDYIDHVDDIIVGSGHTSQLLILESVWEMLSDDDKLYYQAFCDGWTSKTND